MHGRNRDQFHIFENGREQHITSFDEHQPAAAPATHASPVALPPNTYTNAPSYPQAGAVNVLLLDELNTRFEDREFVRLSMLQYVASMPPGTSLAIFALGSRLRLVQNFTSDVAQLTQALQRPKKAKNIPIEVANVGPQITLAAMQQLAQYLGAIPGHKNLIWFASSFSITFDPGASLSAARVAVYPVDAQGLQGMPGFDGAIGGNGDAAALARALDAKFRKENPIRQGMMKDIATATGGHAFLDTNGFKEAVANIIENGLNYYTIGYQPAAGQFDGRYRDIRLRIEPAGYNLAYRLGYFADPPSKPSADNPGGTSLMAETVPGAPPATQILFQARVLPGTDPQLQGQKLTEGPAGTMEAALKEKPVQRYIVDLAVDPHGLTFEETPDGTHQTDIEFTLVAYDADAKRVNYLDRAIRLSLKDKVYARIMAKGLPVRLALDLPPGQITLRIVVHNPSASRNGSLEVPLTIAASQM